MVYLIHFNEAYRHARHYMGFTDDLDARLEAHRNGHGARLIEVVNAAGIEWDCVRTWQGGRKFERRLKNRKDTPRLCPVCAGDKALKRATKVNQ